MEEIEEAAEAEEEPAEEPTPTKPAESEAKTVQAETEAVAGVEEQISALQQSPAPQPAWLRRAGQIRACASVITALLLTFLGLACSCQPLGISQRLYCRGESASKISPLVLLWK
jgi:hypothetical protein